MSLLAIAKQFGRRAAGGLLACVLLLPLPAFAYTISGWQFTDGGVTINDNSVDHKTLSFGATSGGQNFYAIAGPPVVNNVTTENIFGSAGEPVNLFVDLSGLTILRGSLTITLALNDSGTMSSSSVTTTANNFQGSLAPLNLDGNPKGDQVTLSLTFSNNARFEYTASTAGNFYFR